ncbi:MAG TPA: F0F1 ATP synthase subunit C [Persephonella sp.]|uniref:Putative ATP synthase subunit C n=1 Tax=Persephonella marina (strain DSM 14350 / EX-H1) TaxID=123214 RepID=C0QT18_PERMH|nr:MULTISPECIES: ATP synthase subunit C [Persephonella]ACO03591.1 putative ATP synthase subunit C [Persephonella marina EX-H1]HCB70548.1 F0F1 ATP synthase subunit C [Persephonella sp.]
MGRYLKILFLALLPAFAFADEGLAYIAAALAVGLSSLAAGIAVGLVGAAAMGTIGEKPELSGRALIFIGLAEGIAIYGLIIAILILGTIE